MVKPFVLAVSYFLFYYSLMSFRSTVEQRINAQSVALAIDILRQHQEDSIPPYTADVAAPPKGIEHDVYVERLQMGATLWLGSTSIGQNVRFDPEATRALNTLPTKHRPSSRFLRHGRTLTVAFEV